MIKNKQNPTTSIKFEIADSVLNVFSKSRQLHPLDVESCGVLIGSYSVNNTKIWIDEVTTTMPDDVVSRCNFWMKDKGHQIYINKCFSRSSGVLGFIGMWHSHPEDNPTPSAEDYEGWKLCVSENGDRELFFIIIGNKCLNIYTDIKGKFQKVYTRNF